MKRADIFILVLLALLSSAVTAEDHEDAVYLYRSNIMEMAQTHLKALQKYVKGELPIEKHVPKHVDALLALNSMYEDLFPAGKQHPESEALPAVWSDPKGFRQGIHYNRKRIMALKQVDPADMKTMKRAVNEVRMSCGDCHYFFKEGK
ncbi:MAG: cytochrome c [Gammaproteobacteria bacterium]|nr:cytochrome c [Gammaproteobacteria bacterium]NNJ90658.1 cytochrome c [Gammaproteobacteria bacterium]